MCKLVQKQTVVKNVHVAVFSDIRHMTRVKYANVRSESKFTTQNIFCVIWQKYQHQDSSVHV